MPVSASGSTLTFAMVRRLSAVVVVAFCLLAYLYGPALAPGTRSAAIDECNRHAQGNFRSFRLTWQVGARPHWVCADASRPDGEPVSLGWWTSPFGR